MHRYLEPHVLRLEITLSRGASMHKSESYVTSLRETDILNRQHKNLKQQMKRIVLKDTTFPCHFQLKMTASMVPKFLQKTLLIICRVLNKICVIQHPQNAPLCLDAQHSIAKPLQTPVKRPFMHGNIGFASAIIAKAMFWAQALAGSSPRGGRASGPKDNGSNLTTTSAYL
jgi:hypothetical protein